MGFAMLNQKLIILKKASLACLMLTWKAKISNLMLTPHTNSFAMLDQKHIILKKASLPCLMLTCKANISNLLFASGHNSTYKQFCNAWSEAYYTEENFTAMFDVNMKSVDFKLNVC